MASGSLGVSTDESLKIDHLYKLVSDALEDFMKNGFDSASRKFSRKKYKEECLWDNCGIVDYQMLKINYI